MKAYATKHYGSIHRKRWVKWNTERGKSSSKSGVRSSVKIMLRKLY